MLLAKYIYKRRCVFLKMSRVGILVLDSITFRDICDGAYPNAEDIIQYLNTFDTLYYIDTTGYIKDKNYTLNSQKYAILKAKAKEPLIYRPIYTDDVLKKINFLSIDIKNQLCKKLDTFKAKLDIHPLKTLKRYTKPINDIPLDDLENKLNTYYNSLISNTVIIKKNEAAKKKAEAKINKAQGNIKDDLTNSILKMKLKYIELENYKKQREETQKQLEETQNKLKNGETKLSLLENAFWELVNGVITNLKIEYEAKAAKAEADKAKAAKAEANINTFFDNYIKNYKKYVENAEKAKKNLEEAKANIKAAKANIKADKAEADKAEDEVIKIAKAEADETEKKVKTTKPIQEQKVETVSRLGKYIEEINHAKENMYNLMLMYNSCRILELKIKFEAKMNTKKVIEKIKDLMSKQTNKNQNNIIIQLNTFKGNTFDLYLKFIHQIQTNGLNYALDVFIEAYNKDLARKTNQEETKNIMVNLKNISSDESIILYNVFKKNKNSGIVKQNIINNIVTITKNNVIENKKITNLATTIKNKAEKIINDLKLENNNVDCKYMTHINGYIYNQEEGIEYFSEEIQDLQNKINDPKTNDKEKKNLENKKKKLEKQKEPLKKLKKKVEEAKTEILNIEELNKLVKLINENESNLNIIDEKYQTTIHNQIMSYTELRF